MPPRPVHLRVASATLLGLVAVGCAHSHAPPGASPMSARERRSVIADGVVVTATRWDDTLVELAAAEVAGPDRATARERLRERHTVDTVSFTVVVELADRPRDGDVLLAADTWWFRCGGEAPTDVDLVAVDRFPTGDGRAHVRLGFDVRFPERAGGGRTLRLGSKAALAKRPELGRTIARRGVALRW